MQASAQKTRLQVEASLGSQVAGARFGAPDLAHSTDHAGWQLDTLHFRASDSEVIPALFLHPMDTPSPVPAVLYCHAHGNRYERGMAELMDGTPALQGPYGQALMALGIASLCVEMPAFGARQNPSENARAKKHLWNGSTLFGQMLSELASGISFLAEQADVDAARLGVVGFSMGSTHAFWLAALDVRVRACVSLCSFADLECLTRTPAHDGHGIYMTVPGLLAYISTGALAGLAAPRAMLVGAGMQDWSTPERCFLKARAELEAAYSGAHGKLAFHAEPDSGHQETPAMRQSALQFLEVHLCH